MVNYENMFCGNLKCSLIKSEFISTLQAVLPCFVFGKDTSTLRWLGDMSKSRDADGIYFCQSVSGLTIFFRILSLLCHLESCQSFAGSAICS